MLYVYVFSLTTPTAQREHQLRPVGPAKVICQVSDPFRVRTGSYGLLAWLQLPDVPDVSFGFGGMPDGSVLCRIYCPE